jgi:hypothetical protein
MPLGEGPVLAGLGPSSEHSRLLSWKIHELSQQADIDLKRPPPDEWKSIHVTGQGSAVGTTTRPNCLPRDIADADSIKQKQRSSLRRGLPMAVAASVSDERQRVRV